MRLLLAFLVTVTVVGFYFLTYPKIKSLTQTKSQVVAYKMTTGKGGQHHSPTHRGFWYEFRAVLKAISEFIAAITPIVTAIASIIVWRRGRSPAAGHPS
jgi:hypothetical protein